MNWGVFIRRKGVRCPSLYEGFGFTVLESWRVEPGGL